MPFVQPVAERAAAEVEYKYHPSVREAAAHALAGCYRALVVAARAGPPITGEHVGQLLGALMKPLATALNHEREAAAADAMLDVFHDVLRFERETPLGVLQPTTLNAIVGLVKKQLEEDGKRTSERRQAAADDDDDDEPDEDELEAEFNLLSTAGACVREILKLGGAQALPTLETQLMPHINGWMAELSDDAHRSLALVAYADLIELAGKENMKKVVPPVLNTALRLATVATADARLRQAAASAVGAAAEHAGKLLNRNAAAEAARALVAIVTAADAKCAANVGASETAALAIGKLVVHRGAALGAAAQESLQTFLEWLPLRSEDEEAQAATRCLTALIDADAATVMGADGANFPKVLAAVAAALEADSTGDELTAKLRAMVKAWHAADAARLAAGAAALPQPALREKVERAVAAA